LLILVITNLHGIKDCALKFSGKHLALGTTSDLLLYLLEEGRKGSLSGGKR
jgi:hypothetical protein